ncbi:heat shock 70 kDa protein 14-like [Glandiceps talaboti]
MATAIGIYFGSNTCCVAVDKDGRTEVVANDSGERVTPSMVAFTAEERLVGLAAKQGRVRNAVNTVTNVKHFLGKSFKDPSLRDVIKQCSFKVIEKDELCKFAVEYKGRPLEVTPQQVVKLIFNKLMDIAEVHVHHGGRKEDAVIAVPLNFTPHQCTLLSDAAKDVGFNVLHMISEPTAAVLAYNIGQEKPSQTSYVLVYHFGASVLDISVLSVNCGMYRVLANVTDTNHGGEELTRILVEHCASDFKRKWKCDIHDSKRSVSKLHSACETCKHVLSTMQSATVSVDSLYDGFDFNCTISRARLESMFLSTLQNCLQPVAKVLEDAGLNKENIDKVVLSGGSTKIPKLQQLLRDLFPQASVLDTISPDEVVAMGAAVQAGLLKSSMTSNIGEDSSVDCCPKAILVKVLNGQQTQNLKTVISKYSPVPLRQQCVFNLDKNQASTCVHVYESEKEDCQQDSATLLAKLVLRDLPTDSDEALEVTTVFHFKREGSLHITCTEKTSGITENVTIEMCV